jgi:hypothetical protein
MSGCGSGSFVIEARSLASPLSGETRSRTAFGAKTGTRELIVPASLLWKNTCWIGAECRIISSIESPSRALAASQLSIFLYEAALARSFQLAAHSSRRFH